MKFKSEIEEAQFKGVSLILHLILQDLDLLIRGLAKEMMITRVCSSVPGESGVHLDMRAVDIRDEHEGAFIFSPEEVVWILSAINAKWARNDKFDTIIHHKFDGGPAHFHIQIPLSTRAYEKQPIKENVNV